MSWWVSSTCFTQPTLNQALFCSYPVSTRTGPTCAHRQTLGEGMCVELSNYAGCEPRNVFPGLFAREMSLAAQRLPQNGVSITYLD